jgi:hypothetical protein
MLFERDSRPGDAVLMAHLSTQTACQQAIPRLYESFSQQESAAL